MRCKLLTKKTTSLLLFIPESNKYQKTFNATELEPAYIAFTWLLFLPIEQRLEPAHLMCFSMSLLRIFVTSLNFFCSNVTCENLWKFPQSAMQFYSYRQIDRDVNHYIKWNIYFYWISWYFQYHAIHLFLWKYSTSMHNYLLILWLVDGRGHSQWAS